jgi:spore germination protein KC
MIVIKCTGTILALTLLLTGCWSSRDVQKLSYVTAIGLDYKEGQFITYAQVMNFANVAKSENAQIGKVVPLWIGKGTGKTMTESFTSLYATSQQQLIWGHVRVIIVSEDIMKKGLAEAYDMVNRYREIRYNILLYGTKEPLTDLLIEKSIFNSSPLDALIFQPERIYAQRSYIIPEYGFKFIAKIKEPSEPVWLPSVSLNKDVWMEDKKKKDMFRVDGAFFFWRGSMTGWLSEKSVQGARWFQNDFKRSPLNILEANTPIAGLIINKVRYKITPIFEGGRVKYNVKLKVRAQVDELARNISVKELEGLTEKIIAEEVRETYKNGLTIKADVLHLDDELFRNHHKKWLEYSDGDTFNLTENSLNLVEVNAKIINTGTYKGRTN